MTNGAKRVIVYARLSVARGEESVSIGRQLEQGRRYATLRGWTVVDEVIDNGVSASKTRPEQRVGWRTVLERDDPFDAVIVWKIDRLARRVSDFNNAVDALKARRATVVAVEQSIDMTSPYGEAMAQIIAVFAQLEAAEISSRVASTRRHLIHLGRLPGGTVPYGFMAVPNSEGAGYVLAQDPDTAHFVRSMVDRALDGASVYSIQQWLNGVSAPLPKSSQKNRKRNGWHYSTVERILRSPVLAGMTPFNPGNAGKARGDDVLRDDTGVPVVDDSVALISTSERRKLLALLDNRHSPQAKPRGGKAVTSPLLSGLVVCGDCDRRMHRGTNTGRPVLNCPECFQTITTTQLIAYLERRLLAERGDWSGWERLPAVDDDASSADVQEAIDDVLRKMGHDDADIARLSDQLAALKEKRAETARSRSTGSVVLRYTGTVRQQWEAAQDDEARRGVLLSAMESVQVVRGKAGRYLDPARVHISWKPASPDDDEADQPES